MIDLIQNGVLPRVHNGTIESINQGCKMSNVVNRTVYRYHVTLKTNWMPIGVMGLQVSYSSGAMDAVWLVSKHKLQWAVQHVCNRYGVKPHDLCVVRVRVRRSWLRRNKVKGAWYCVRDINPCRIEWIKDWPSLSVAMKTHNTLRVLDDRSV